MDSSISFGGLIPLWILGAPLLAGLIALLAAPRTGASVNRDSQRPIATTGLASQRL